MCRQNHLWGSIVLAFGLGLLAGAWLKSGFASCLIGFGLVVFGVCIVRKH